MLQLFQLIVPWSNSVENVLEFFLMSLSNDFSILLKKKVFAANLLLYRSKKEFLMIFFYVLIGPTV